MSKKNPTELNLSQRYRLTDEEEKVILNFREQKSLLKKEAEKAGIDPDEINHYWYKSKLFSMFIKPKTKSLEDLKEHLLKDLAKHTPKYPVIKRIKQQDTHCLVIDPADIHIGKLGSKYETGEEYNVKLAVKRVSDGIDILLNRAKVFNIDKIVLLIGNDILHTDNTRRQTTSGTPQDTDGQWYDNFLIAKDLYVNVIEKLMTVADVHVMHDPSNHDYMSGWFLAQTISSWFRLSKNVTFDVSIAHRKAFVYHENLIGSTHGDGAKQQDLPLLMAQEFKNEWAATKHRYIYVKHVHHKTSKDYIGITVESSRSVSGTDSWHHRNGYQHSPKAIEAYLHHPINGQVARFTHKF